MDVLYRVNDINFYKLFRDEYRTRIAHLSNWGVLPLNYTENVLTGLPAFQ